MLIYSRSNFIFRYTIGTPNQGRIVPKDYLIFFHNGNGPGQKYNALAGGEASGKVRH